MDGDGSKVRLVRCPTCGNLLPELRDFSLYKCGGCGAVLQANKQGSRSEDLFEISEEEKVEGISEKEKHGCEKNNSLINSSSSKAQDKVSAKAINQSSRVETMDLYYEKSNLRGEAVYFDGRHNPYSRPHFNNQVHENGEMESRKRNSSTFSNPHVGSSDHRSSCRHDFGVQKRVESLEHDQAELLRKIDELKIQLGSSSDTRDKPRDINPKTRTMKGNFQDLNGYITESMYRPSLQPFATDQNVLDPVYRDYKHGQAVNIGHAHPPNRVLYEQPYHDQFMGHNMGLNPKMFSAQRCINGPQCSCFQCYRNWQLQSRAPHHMSSGSYGSHGQNFVRSSNFDFNSHSLNEGLVRRAIPHGTKRVCRPRAGGAPFLACPRCFMLLKFPKSCKKIRCGACLELILLEIKKNGVVVTAPTELGQVFTKCDIGYDEAHIEDVKTLDDFLKADEFENPETNSLSRDDCVKSSRSSERNGLISSSSSFSEDEKSPDSVIVVRENSKSADLAFKDDPPLQENPVSDEKLEPDDDYDDFVFSRCGMGNKSKRASRQNSVKDVQMVTEKEVVYSDVAVSEEASEGEDQPRIDEESESFFGGFLKKSIKKLLRPSDNMEMSRIDVFVNGHPVTNRAVKKAEKLAGPIQPGDYWYDYRAGFWGVMGQPCHGIVPPFIEEFNYSMPRKCASGNSGVFVNGRELHESDLELLARRGLPTTRDKFYMIEISGRVVDEYTGEELDDLGKLAPTVEKVRHGFGMRPRAIAEE